MSWKTGVRAGSLAAAITMALFVTAASAAAGVAPRLLSPNHKHVAPGKIKLVVEIPVRPNRHGVFIAISPKHKLDKARHLKECSGKRCDFVSPKHAKGHKYTYVATFNFPGYWAVTPGKYYWQVHYYTPGDTAVRFSKIGSFVVN